MAMHRDMGVRAPVANHHLGAGAIFAGNQPFRFPMPALHQLDIFFVYGNDAHKTSDPVPKPSIIPRYFSLRVARSPAPTSHRLDSQSSYFFPDPAQSPWDLRPF